MRHRIRFFVIAGLALSTNAFAQNPPAAPTRAAAPAAQNSIDPGMSRAQVVERFGKPASEHSRGEFMYLFYSNGVEKSVGMSDLVVLQGDKVVDAVLRSARRTYSGTSSSPKAISAKEAAKGKPTTLKTGDKGA